MKSYIIDTGSNLIKDKAANLKALANKYPSAEGFYTAIKKERIAKVTQVKIYPVNIRIVHASGRIEELTIRARLEAYQRDLKLMHQAGSVTEYSIETEQDRINKRA